MTYSIVERLKDLSEHIINTFELQDDVTTQEWDAIDKEAYRIVLAAKVAGMAKEEIESLLFYTHHNFIDELFS